MTYSDNYLRSLITDTIATRGYINLTGYDSDPYRNADYFDDGEIDSLRHLITAHDQRQSQNAENTSALKFKKLDQAATAPQRSKELDAGYDVTSVEEVWIAPRQNYLVPTGIAIETPRGTYAAVHPRSGYAAKHRVTVTNAPGTVDEGYRGEVLVNIINHGELPFKVQKGMKIAQLVIQKYETPEVIEVDELSDTERGTAGHGSTGTHSPDAPSKGN